MSKHRKPRGSCATCGGKGWQLLNNSWQLADGFRKERCGICAGTGDSVVAGEAAFVRMQAACRKIVGEKWNGRLVPRPHEIRAALNMLHDARRNGLADAAAQRIRTRADRLNANP